MQTRRGKASGGAAAPAAPPPPAPPKKTIWTRAKLMSMVSNDYFSTYTGVADDVAGLALPAAMHPHLRLFLLTAIAQGKVDAATLSGCSPWSASSGFLDRISSPTCPLCVAVAALIILFEAGWSSPAAARPNDLLDAIGRVWYTNYKQLQNELYKARSKAAAAARAPPPPPLPRIPTWDEAMYRGASFNAHAVEHAQAQLNTTCACAVCAAAGGASTWEAADAHAGIRWLRYVGNLGRSHAAPGKKTAADVEPAYPDTQVHLMPVLHFEKGVGEVRSALDRAAALEAGSAQLITGALDKDLAATASEALAPLLTLIGDISSDDIFVSVVLRKQVETVLAWRGPGAVTQVWKGETDGLELLEPEATTDAGKAALASPYVDTVTHLINTQGFDALPARALRLIEASSLVELLAGTDPAGQPVAATPDFVGWAGNPSPVTLTVAAYEVCEQTGAAFLTPLKDSTDPAAMAPDLERLVTLLGVFALGQSLTAMRANAAHDGAIGLNKKGDLALLPRWTQQWIPVCPNPVGPKAGSGGGGGAAAGAASGAAAAAATTNSSGGDNGGGSGTASAAASPAPLPPAAAAGPALPPSAPATAAVSALAAPAPVPLLAPGSWHWAAGRPLSALPVWAVVALALAKRREAAALAGNPFLKMANGALQGGDAHHAATAADAMKEFPLPSGAAAVLDAGVFNPRVPPSPLAQLRIQQGLGASPLPPAAYPVPVPSPLLALGAAQWTAAARVLASAVDAGGRQPGGPAVILPVLRAAATFAAFMAATKALVERAVADALQRAAGRPAALAGGDLLGQGPPSPLDAVTASAGASRHALFTRLAAAVLVAGGRLPRHVLTAGGGNAGAACSCSGKTPAAAAAPHTLPSGAPPSLAPLWEAAVAVLRPGADAPVTTAAGQPGWHATSCPAHAAAVAQAAATASICTAATPDPPAAGWRAECASLLGLLAARLPVQLLAHVHVVARGLGLRYDAWYPYRRTAASAQVADYVCPPLAPPKRGAASAGADPMAVKLGVTNPQVAAVAAGAGLMPPVDVGAWYAATEAATLRSAGIPAGVYWKERTTLLCRVGAADIRRYELSGTADLTAYNADWPPSASLARLMATSLPAGKALRALPREAAGTRVPKQALKFRLIGPLPAVPAAPAAAAAAAGPGDSSSAAPPPQLPNVSPRINNSSALMCKAVAIGRLAFPVNLDMAGFHRSLCARPGCCKLPVWDPFAPLLTGAPDAASEAVIRAAPRCWRCIFTVYCSVNCKRAHAAAHVWQCPGWPVKASGRVWHDEVAAPVASAAQLKAGRFTLQPAIRRTPLQAVYVEAINWLASVKLTANLLQLLQDKHPGVTDAMGGERQADGGLKVTVALTPAVAAGGPLTRLLTGDAVAPGRRQASLAPGAPVLGSSALPSRDRAGWAAALRALAACEPEAMGALPPPPPASVDVAPGAGGGAAAAAVASDEDGGAATAASSGGGCSSGSGDVAGADPPVPPPPTFVVALHGFCLNCGCAMTSVSNATPSDGSDGQLDGFCHHPLACSLFSAHTPSSWEQKNLLAHPELAAAPDALPFEPDAGSAGVSHWSVATREGVGELMPYPAAVYLNTCDEIGTQMARLATALSLRTNGWTLPALWAHAEAAAIAKGTAPRRTQDLLGLRGGARRLRHRSSGCLCPAGVGCPTSACLLHGGPDDDADAASYDAWAGGIEDPGTGAGYLLPPAAPASAPIDATAPGPVAEHATLALADTTSSLVPRSWSTALPHLCAAWVDSTAAYDDAVLSSHLVLATAASMTAAHASSDGVGGDVTLPSAAALAGDPLLAAAAGLKSLADALEAGNVAWIPSTGRETSAFKGLQALTAAVAMAEHRLRVARRGALTLGNGTHPCLVSTGLSPMRVPAALYLPDSLTSHLRADALSVQAAVTTATLRTPGNRGAGAATFPSWRAPFRPPHDAYGISPHARPYRAGIGPGAFVGYWHGFSLDFNGTNVYSQLPVSSEAGAVAAAVATSGGPLGSLLAPETHPADLRDLTLAVSLFANANAHNAPTVVAGGGRVVAAKAAAAGGGAGGGAGGTGRGGKKKGKGGGGGDGGSADTVLPSRRHVLQAVSIPSARTLHTLSTSVALGEAGVPPAAVAAVLRQVEAGKVSVSAVDSPASLLQMVAAEATMATRNALAKGRRRAIAKAEAEEAVAWAAARSPAAAAALDALVPICGSEGIGGVAAPARVPNLLTRIDAETSAVLLAAQKAGLVYATGSGAAAPAPAPAPAPALGPRRGAAAVVAAAPLPALAPRGAAATGAGAASAAPPPRPAAAAPAAPADPLASARELEDLLGASPAELEAAAAEVLRYRDTGGVLAAPRGYVALTRQTAFWMQCLQVGLTSRVSRAAYARNVARLVATGQTAPDTFASVLFPLAMQSAGWGLVEATADHTSVTALRDPRFLSSLPLLGTTPGSSLKAAAMLWAQSGVPDTALYNPVPAAPEEEEEEEEGEGKKDEAAGSSGRRQPQPRLTGASASHFSSSSDGSGEEGEEEGEGEEEDGVAPQGGARAGRPSRATAQTAAALGLPIQRADSGTAAPVQVVAAAAAADTTGTTAPVLLSASGRPLRGAVAARQASGASYSLNEALKRLGGEDDTTSSSSAEEGGGAGREVLPHRGRGRDHRGHHRGHHRGCGCGSDDSDSAAPSTPDEGSDENDDDSGNDTDDSPLRGRGGSAKPRRRAESAGAAGGGKPRARRAASAGPRAPRASAAVHVPWAKVAAVGIEGETTRATITCVLCTVFHREGEIEEVLAEAQEHVVEAHDSHDGRIPEGKGHLACPCGWVAARLGKLDIHIKGVHLKFRWHCDFPDCGFAGTKPGNTQRHYNSEHLGKKYPCKYNCGEEFMRLDNMQRHARESCPNNPNALNKHKQQKHK